jgi:hypothetical protein
MVTADLILTRPEFRQRATACPMMRATHKLRRSFAKAAFELRDQNKSVAVNIGY